MKTLYKNSPRINIILYIVIALVAIGIIGLIIALTSGGSVQSFYVTINDKNIMESDYDYILSKEEFTDVKMNFLSLDEDNGNYGEVYEFTKNNSRFRQIKHRLFN